MTTITSFFVLAGEAGAKCEYRGANFYVKKITTGLAYFAECQRHSAKAGKHSAKKSPSVALGEAHTVFLLPAKPALPSVFSRALGKPLPCAMPHSAKKLKRDGRTAELANGTANWRTGRPNGTGRKLCRVPDARHSAKIQTSSSAKLAALGEVWIFAECQASGTRRSLGLCRVSGVWHSAKFETSPSAKVITLGKYVFQEIEKWLLCRVSG